MGSIVTQEEALAWVAAMFAEAPGRLTPDTARADIAEWDSLGVLTVMASLDSDFDIVLSDEEVQSMRKVNDILDILRKNGKLG
ncbi:MAG: acyl carrier protein [Bryobacteraceae bacterium]